MVSGLVSMMTTVQDSTSEDSTETTTPVEVIHQTTGDSITSSSTLGAGFSFQLVAPILAVVAAVANGLVLYAMVASKQHKKHVLIFNQNVLEFVNCVFFALGIPAELINIYLSGMGGYWLCLTLVSYAGASATFMGSLFNLAAVSIERYLKVVHHVWAKNKLRNWMIYSELAFSWICGAVITVGVVVPSITVVNGVCYAGMLFLDQTARKIYIIWDFLSFYVIMLLIFIFCYGRILMAIRRQAKVMAAHSGKGSNTVQDQTNKIQTNIIKTMILVCVLFAITWAPAQIYFLLITFNVFTMNDNNGLYTVLSVGYVYMCANPFIYATKFDPVRGVLMGLIPCKKSNMQAPESVIMQ